MAVWYQGSLVLGIYAAIVLLVGILAASMGRRIPALLLAAMAALPFIFLGGGVFSERTLLPVDHALAIPPWKMPPGMVRYNPYANDVATQFLPWAAAVRAAWREGSLPWRDRWNGCGTPLASNGQSEAFSPLTLLSLPLALPSAFLLTAAVKLFLAATGMFLWLRLLGASPGPALFGSVAYSFSFTMIPWLFAPQTSVVSFWPWLMLALELLRDRVRERKAFRLLVALLVILFLSGHIESTVAGLLFAMIWLAARWLMGDLPDMARLLTRLGIAIALGVALTAFSLLPLALAILSSNRIVNAAQPFWFPHFSAFPHGPVWKGAAYTSFLPRAFGDAMESPILPGSPASFIEMALGYAGIVTSAVAAFLLRPGSRRSRNSWALLVPAAIGFGTATGTWPFAELFGHLPLIRFMFPIRFLSWIALAISAIAALELDRFCRDLRTSRRVAGEGVALMTLMGVWIAMVAAHLRPRHSQVALGPQREALVVAEAALAIAAVILLAGLLHYVGGSRAIPYALAAVCAAELWFQGARLYRYGSAADLFPATPLIEFLRRQPRTFRVVAEDGILFPNSNVFAGVEDIRTHDPVERRDYVEFLDASCGFPPADYFKSVTKLDASVFSFLNVRFLISVHGRESPGPQWHLVYDAEDGTVFENREVLPRVFAPETVTRVASAGVGAWVRNAQAAFRMPAPDLAGPRNWHETAFVLSSQAGTVKNGRADVFDYRESTNTADFRVRVPDAGGVLLLTSLVQDGGWSARDGGRKTLESTLANGPFLALRLPAGERTVHLQYRPPGFRLGAWASSAAVVVLIAWAFRNSRRRFIA